MCVSINSSFFFIAKQFFLVYRFTVWWKFEFFLFLAVTSNLLLHLHTKLWIDICHLFFWTNAWIEMSLFYDKYRFNLKYIDCKLSTKWLNVIGTSHWHQRGVTTQPPEPASGRGLSQSSNLYERPWLRCEKPIY